MEHMDNIRRLQLQILFLLFIFLPGIYSQAYGQVRFDYISDWPNLFLSNINLVSKNIQQTDYMSSAQSENKLNFNSQMIFHDFYREQSGILKRNISQFQQLTSLNTQIEISKQAVLVGLQYGISQKNMNYDMTDTKSFRLHNAYKEYQIFASTSLFQNYLTITGSLGRKILNNFEYNPWNFGARFNPTKSISISYHRYEDFFRWEYNIHVDFSSEFLIADEYSQMDEYGIRISLIPELAISAKMQNNYINKDHYADSPTTILIPSGTHYQRRIILNIFPENRIALNMQYYNRSHDMMGYFYNSHQTFGKITEQKDHLENYQAEVLYRTKSYHLGFTLGWASGMMSTNGHVESWPFTSAMIDLLGVRYNFRSHLNYDLFRGGVKYQYHSSDWQFTFKSSFERISPGGGARTWEPEMFIFGVKNVNIYNLPAKNWDGLYLGLNLRKSFGELFQLAYEFQQYVPLEINDSSQSDNLLENNEPIQKSVYGGGIHKVYFVLKI